MMLEHELNSNNHHQGCLDMDQITIMNDHRGRLDIEKIPIIILINRYK